MQDIDRSKYSTDLSVKTFRNQRSQHKLTALDKPFVAWDGEGITDDIGEHHTILFGASTGHHIHGKRLNTVECLNLILNVERAMPHAVHVGFAFGYDVEMMLKDIPLHRMDYLHKHNVIRWGAYRLEYIKGKYFRITAKFGNKKVVVQIWDIFSFFRASFVKTIEQYLGKETPHLEEIKAGKKERQNFQYSDLEYKIKPYWQLELKYTVELMDKFRDLLWEAGLKLTRWHGPGAVATYLFGKNSIKQHVNHGLPDEIITAGQYAFAAGRFEPFRIGRANCRIYKYDINSAHPATIVKLPSMRNPWRHLTDPDEIMRCLYAGQFGVYKISYDAAVNGIDLWHVMAPHPYHVRDKRACVHYPMVANSWRWTPEILAALPTMQSIEAEFFITEAWVLEDDGTRPFEFVHEMYYQRQEWKRQGNQAEYALKLGINSLFGKTAQKAGWKPGKDLPRYHQLEWAGYITSGTRALLWPVIWEAYQKGGLIACETDSVMSTVPLDTPILSKKLGEWDLEIWDDLVYLQNGIYWYQTNGKWNHKFRGLDPESLTVDDAIRYLERVDFRVPYSLDGATQYGPLMGTTTRFIGSKVAIQGNADKRCTWEENKPRAIHVGSEGKRIHDHYNCTICIDNYVSPSERMHDLRVAELYLPRDYPHALPWREGIIEQAEEFEVMPEGFMQ